MSTLTDRLVVLSESTLTILKTVNNMVSVVTCGHAKEFKFVTIEIVDHGETQSSVMAEGKIELDCLASLVKLKMLLEFDVIGNEWSLGPNAEIAVRHPDRREITFHRNPAIASFHPGTKVDREEHEMLLRQWGINIDFKLVVDCDSPVYVPSGLVVAEEQLPNRVRGLVKLGSQKIRQHLAPGQESTALPLDIVREALISEPVYTAHVLDHLLANTELIPEEWKGLAVCFWGTIYYRPQYHYYCVRYLFWEAGGWHWRYFSFPDGGVALDQKCPAAVR